MRLENTASTKAGVLCFVNGAGIWVRNCALRLTSVTCFIPLLSQCVLTCAFVLLIPKCFRDIASKCFELNYQQNGWNGAKAVHVLKQMNKFTNKWKNPWVLICRPSAAPAVTMLLRAQLQFCFLELGALSGGSTGQQSTELPVKSPASCSARRCDSADHSEYKTIAIRGGDPIYFIFLGGSGCCGNSSFTSSPPLPYIDNCIMQNVGAACWCRAVLLSQTCSELCAPCFAGASFWMLAVIAAQSDCVVSAGAEPGVQTGI